MIGLRQRGVSCSLWAMASFVFALSDVSRTVASPLSTTTVLLPASPSVAYKLDAEGGCYQTWYSTAPQVVDIVPERPALGGCARTASIFVKAGARLAKRQSLSVFASGPDASGSSDDPEREEQWRIFVDNIVRLEILSTYRDFFMHDTGFFRVQAFDGDGNVFTSLQGLSFRWTMTPQGTSKDTVVLKKVGLNTVHDSTVHVTSRMIEMESQGSETYLRAFHGTSTGAVQLLVALVDDSLRAVPAAEAAVIVTENLMLMPQRPAPLTIAPAAAFCFTLGALRGQRNDKGEHAISHSQFTKFDMPCTEYKWRSEQSSVAPIDKDVGCVCGVELGESTVHVEDQTLESNKQAVDLHVAVPHKLQLHVYHLGDKPLVEQRELTNRGISAAQLNPPLSDAVAHVLVDHSYEVNAFLFTVGSEEMLVTPNTNFDFKVDKSFLSIEDSRHHHLAIHTRRSGITTVNATLQPIRPPEGCVAEMYTTPAPVSTVLTISIDERIVVSPTCPIHLPFAEDSAAHTFQLSSSEGSLKHRWHTEQSSPAVSITHTGLLRVEGLGPDGQEVIVTDAHILVNRAACKVVSSIPNGVTLTATKIAVAVGTETTVFAQASAPGASGYHNCSKLPFKWSIADNTIFSDEGSEELRSDAPFGACAHRQLAAMRPGVTVVRAVYVDAYGSPRHDGTIEITAYMPLDVITPASRKLLVVLGSTSPVEFQGGPSGGMDSISAADPSKVGITKPPGSGSKFAWRVMCLAVHTQILTLVLTHPEQPSMRFTATVEYECALPASLAIQPSYEVWPPKSALPAKASRRVLARGSAEMRLLAFNAEGRMFDDIDSIKIGWEARSQAKKEVANWSPESPKVSKCRAPLREVNVHNRRETVLLAVLPGSIRWTWDKKQHTEKIPKSVYLPQQPRWKAWRPRGVAAWVKAGKAFRKLLGIRGTHIGALMELILLPHIAISPAKVAIFRHPRNQVSLAVSGGSGAIQVKLSDPSFVDYRIDYKERVIMLTPKECGALQVTVEDKGLYGSEPVYADVLVSDITKVRLHVAPQLALSTTATARLGVHASDGNEFPQDQYKHMDFSWHEFDTKRLQVDASTQPGSATVTGTASGTAFLRASASGLPGTSVHTDKAQIHVFPKLQLMPRHLHLLLGGEFQFQANGGPMSGFKPSFTISNSTVASIQQSEGFVHAVALGDAFVTLTEYALNSAEVLASDTAKLTVITLDESSQLRISQPANKLLVGNQMSVYVTGPQGESPFMFSFGMEKSFKWEISPSSLSILTLVDNEGNSVPKSDGSFGMRLQGISPGKATVTVQVEWDPPCCQGSSCSVKPCMRHTVTLRAQATVMVSAGLRLLGPSTVVLPRNTRYMITTNMDVSNLIFEPTSRGVITVDSSGLVTSTDNLNSCHVIVRTASGDQSIAVTFHIRKIAQLMLVMPPLQHQRADDVAVAMPLGGSADVAVVVQDNVGTAFTAIRDYDNMEANSQVSFLRDRTDVVTVAVHQSGQKLTVSSMNQGMVTLRVWLNDYPTIDDYLRILVDNIIEPGSAEVVVGGTVQYSIALRNMSTPNAKTKWSSSNSGIATVDAESGTAHVLTTGTTHINVAGPVRSYVQLTAVRLALAQFVGVDTSTMVRNFDGKMYRAEINVKDKNGKSLFPLSHPGIDHKLKVACSIPHSAALWAETWAEWDKDSGRHVCAIRPLLPQIGSDEDTRLFIKEMQLHLTVMDASSTDVLHANTTIVYMHAFRVSHHGTTQRSPEKLKLRLKRGDAENVELFGNAANVVAGSYSDKVVAVTSKGLGIGGSEMWEIKRTGRMAKDRIIQVTFECRVTGQSEIVEVEMVDSAQWSWDQLWYALLGYLESAQFNTAVAGLIILVALYFLVSGSVETQTQSHPAERQSEEHHYTGSRSLHREVGSPLRPVPGGSWDLGSPSAHREHLFGAGMGMDRAGRATVTTPKRYDNF